MKNFLIDIEKPNFLDRIPSLPGVYQFIDDNEKVIYVGKSVNLKSRISSYFLTDVLPKTKKMISNARYLKFIVTYNEFEALILEAELIKTEKPKYNVIQKDDKSPIYIKITNEFYPRVLLCRKTEIENDKKSSYFGPYLSAKDAKELTRTIRKFIPFAEHKPDDKKCLYSQMGLCDPCPSLIEEIKDKNEKRKLRRIYLKNIYRVKKVLQGKISLVYQKLKTEFDQLVEREQFENARDLYKKISFLEKLTQKVNYPSNYLENPNLVEELRESEIEDFRKFLSKFYKIGKLKRIECFDISHTSGQNVVGSMVVFLNGERQPSLYRRFKVLNSKNDDFSSIREVIERRAKHFKDWGVPDLIVIDGGKPQIMAVFNIIQQKNGIPVVGIAKENEEIVIPLIQDRNISFLKREIKKESFGNLIVRIRDESHRFAKRYHRLLRDNLKKG